MLIKTSAAAVALCTGAVLLTGCGSTSHTTAPSAEQASASAGVAGASAAITVGQAPPKIGNQIQGGIQSGVNPEAASHQRAIDGDAVTTQRGKNVKADEAPESVKLSTSGKARSGLATTANRTIPNPCALVSLAQARAGIGHQVTASHLAPLGPSCVFTLAHPAGTMTVQVESVYWTPKSAGIRKNATVDVGGRVAYCRTSHTQALFAPVARGEVLVISGPCAIAARLASVALPRLGAAVRHSSASFAARGTHRTPRH